MTSGNGITNDNLAGMSIRQMAAFLMLILLITFIYSGKEVDETSYRLEISTFDDQEYTVFAPIPNHANDIILEEGNASIEIITNNTGRYLNIISSDNISIIHYAKRHGHFIYSFHDDYDPALSQKKNVRADEYLIYYNGTSYRDSLNFTNFNLVYSISSIDPTGDFNTVISINYPLDDGYYYYDVKVQSEHGYGFPLGVCLSGLLLFAIPLLFFLKLLITTIFFSDDRKG